MGYHRRSQAAGHSVHRLCPGVSRDRRDRSDDHAHPAHASAQRFCFAAGLQPDVHHARNHHDLLRGHACPVRIRQLPHPAHDWRAGHGVSASECFQFLDDRIRWPASLFQPGGRQRTVRSGKRSRRWVVRLRTADFADVFSWPQHRLLDAGAAGLRLWQHRHGDQHHRHRSLHALPGNDAWPKCRCSPGSTSSWPAW